MQSLKFAFLSCFEASANLNFIFEDNAHIVCRTSHSFVKLMCNEDAKHAFKRFRCIRQDGPAARCSGRPKLPRQFVPVRNFESRLFVPMPGNMGRPAFTFINLYIFCNLQRIINQNIHLDYVCIYFLIRKFVCLFVCWQAH